MVTPEISEDDYDKLESAYDRLIRPLIRDRQWGGVVDQLKRLLDAEASGGFRLLLLFELKRALSALQREEEALPVIREMIELAPDDPLTWASLAGWHFYAHGFYEADNERLQHALDAIDKAVERARHRGNWLRQCLNDRCRIVVAMKRYDLLEQSMREILSIPPQPGVPDIRIEDDFLRRAPEGAIEPALLAKYRTAYAAQEARRSQRSQE